jgi:transposase
MYRVTLTDEQRQELQRRTRQRAIVPSIRDRLEMIRLSDAGWSVPKSARSLGQHDQTVRFWIKAFLAGEFDALPNQPRGGKQSTLTAAMLDDLRSEITISARTWTAKHLADWLADRHGIRLRPGRLRVHLKRAKLSYQRTSRSLKHKQKPDEVAEKRALLQECLVFGSAVRARHMGQKNSWVSPPWCSYEP